jgi:hypothetical protein
MNLWLTSMSNGGELENIREMVDPLLPWLDGIIWVLHDTDPSDPGAQYLESVKGKGRVIYRTFNQRHWFSMDETLFCGLIEEGDLVMWSDLLERPSPHFVSYIKTELDAWMQRNGIECCLYYGKPFVFRYNESLHYYGSPHWSLLGVEKAMTEFSTLLPNEKDVRLNVRPLKRTDPYQWINHYARYWLFPAGSNHALLGLEKQGNPAELFPKREANRLAFRREMKKRGFSLTLDGLRTMLSQPLDDILKGYVNNEKTLNDYYRFVIQGDKTVVDSHDPKDMKQI